MRCAPLPEFLREGAHPVGLAPERPINTRSGGHRPAAGALPPPPPGGAPPAPPPAGGGAGGGVAPPGGGNAPPRGESIRRGARREGRQRR